jgi:hypothetical protein
MTFALYCHNKHSKMATKPLSLALGYTIEVVVGLGDIVYIIESDFTNKRGFRNLI